MNLQAQSPALKTAANVLGIVVLIALVAPFAVYAAPEAVGADESFVVLTPSMTPAIAPGDVVIVTESDPTAVVEGDVITFVRGTSDVPVTHRVLDVVPAAGGIAFETKGDANDGPDPGLVPGSNLVGVVILTIPYIGYVIQFASTRAGFITLVVLPFGLIVASELLRIVRTRSGDDGDASESTAPADPEPSAEHERDIDPELTAADTDEISADAVGGAVAVLVVFAPYVVYVAVELQSAASIAVAVASVTVLFGSLAVWIPTSDIFDRVALERSTSTTSVADDPESRSVAVDSSPASVADEAAAGPAQTDGSGEVE